MKRRINRWELEKKTEGQFFQNKFPKETQDVEDCVTEIIKETLKHYAFAHYEVFDERKLMIICKACDKHQVDMNYVLKIIQAHKDYYL